MKTTIKWLIDSLPSEVVENNKILFEVGNVECKFTKRTVMKYRVNTNMPTKLVAKKSLNTNIEEIILDLKKVWDLTTTAELDKRTLIIQIKDKLLALKK